MREYNAANKKESNMNVGTTEHLITNENDQNITPIDVLQNKQFSFVLPSMNQTVNENQKWVSGSSKNIQQNLNITPHSNDRTPNASIEGGTINREQ